MAERRALWVSTSLHTKGGIASYVRELQRTPLWSDWSIRHVATHRDGSAAAKIASFGCGALVLMVEMIRHRPTVIHLHSSSDASFVRKAILFWLCQPSGVPVVLHMHGSDFQEYYDDSSRWVKAVIRATLSRASAVVALGQTWADRLRAIAPVARITIIPNAVRVADCTAQPRPGEPVHVAFLGRIGERKGTFRLLDAWAKLASESDTQAAAVLTIAGDGEVENARSRIRELGLDDTVEVREWLSQDAVEELLGQAQVLALPSRNEGQPMAVLEAMARGLCIVCSDVGGLPEMIGGGCGVVVSPSDVEVITEALRVVIHDEQLRVGYGAAARQRFMERFEVGIVSRRIEELYLSIEPAGRLALPRHG